MQQIQTQSQPPVTAAGAPAKVAPPKQVAVAMERLTQAGRLIADIRLGVDRVLEALFVSSDPHQTNKQVNLFVKEDAAIRHHLQDLRAIGWKLEESRVLDESLRSRINSWGLHMPLVCPDGAVVAYAWKRQLAGQAGASAVDRTRLALKAFTDQKRRFFPHLDDKANGRTSINEPGAKRHAGFHVVSPLQELHCGSLSGVLKRLEKEVPQMKIYTHQRLEWLKKALALSSSSSLNENPETPRNHSFRPSATKLLPGSGKVTGAADEDNISVIEILIPSVFRALISLHSAGSMDPDAVSFFSPDERGSYVHQEAYQLFTYLSMLRNKPLWQCSFFSVLNAMQYYTSYCAGSALTKRYSQRFAASVEGCFRSINNLRYSYLL
ncbi:unnamed protein product [Rhodiola kirilowii]